MSEKKQKVCMLCGKPSEDSICDECKSNVQGEAAHRKQKIEKQVKVGSEVEKDKIVKKELEK
ncbi:MAG: hypothetical protein AAF462_01870 [Thermodesulfobacteriota bacterium]